MRQVVIRLTRMTLTGGLLASGANLALAQAAETAAHQPTALVWTAKRIELRAELGQERMEAVFSFHNPTAHHVTITAVESSCGCTTARLAKSIYRPGDIGEIRAIFEFGDRTGPQQKVLTVHTDDAKVATQLVLRVEIPEAITLDRTVLQWERGEPAATKTLFASTPSAEVEITRLSFDATRVDAQLAPATAGGGYVLTLRPLNTESAQRHSVRIDAVVAGRPRSLPVYVFVR